MGDLNYDELVVYNNYAVIPAYLIVYAGGKFGDAPRQRCGSEVDGSA